MNCYRCKKETKLKKVQKYKYMGISPKNVYLNNIEVRICESCALTSPLIPKIVKLHNTIASAIICQKSLLLGEEVRFLRKNLRLKAQDWAKYLRKDVATISRAEKDGNVLNKDLDLLIRLAYVRLWEEKNEIIFSEKIVETITIFEDLEQCILIDVEKIEEFSHFEKEDILEKEFLYDWNFDQPNQNAVLLSVTKTKTVNNLYATNTNFAFASEEILSCGISFSS